MRIRSFVSRLLHSDEENCRDHPLLLQMQALIDRMVSAPAASYPFKCLMTGCELLLLKVTEWGVYAHRGVALASSDEVSKLQTLCSGWRQQELESWSSFIQSKEDAWNRDVAVRLWYRMYRLLILRRNDDVDAPPNLCEGEFSTERLYQFLCEFIESAPIGDFPIRHSLLGTFGRHLFCRGIFLNQFSSISYFSLQN